HHSRHHKAYVDKLNDAVIQAKIDKPDLDTLMRHISKYSTAIRNNGGGHWNHSMFWQIMKPGSGGAPSGELAAAINTAFGSFDEFKTKFNATAMSRFGSGWAWLVVRDGKLEIGSTPNQDNPLMDVSDFKGTPLLALDVWEHAYYLKYQNKRADYVQAWWNLIHWDEVTRRFKKL
ncbi:MAG TPA: superoxide dismutase, partial [bacterium]|nr:superoxide dismutase [bacterium]